MRRRKYFAGWENYHYNRKLKKVDKWMGRILLVVGILIFATALSDYLFFRFSTIFSIPTNSLLICATGLYASFVVIHLFIPNIKTEEDLWIIRLNKTEITPNARNPARILKGWFITGYGVIEYGLTKDSPKTKVSIDGKQIFTKKSIYATSSRTMYVSKTKFDDLPVQSI